MSFTLGGRVRIALAPPRYLASPLSGIDLSTSGVKAVRLVEEPRGLILTEYTDTRLPSGAYAEGEIVDRAAVVRTIAATAKSTGISAATISLPESKSYLFETEVEQGDESEQRLSVEQHLDELIPLPPREAMFDFVETGRSASGASRIVGIGFARRIVDDILTVFDEAGVKVLALEGESFAAARALLPVGDRSTTLIIDVGRSTTKITIVVHRIPHFTTTIGIGGHALTLACQKHFGVTEAEARRIKAEKGIVPVPGNEDYLAVMLSTISAIRDEITRRLSYWQERAVGTSEHSPVTSAILVGGNASVRGFPEYLEGTLKIPVTVGDVFTNCASRDRWIPPLDFSESLAYATSVGLALRNHRLPYA